MIGSSDRRQGGARSSCMWFGSQSLKPSMPDTTRRYCGAGQADVAGWVRRVHRTQDARAAPRSGTPRMSPITVTGSCEQ